MSGLKVIQSGVHSLVQDAGRYGFHNIGLTTGGPLDHNSFRWANRLCENEDSAACLEILVGGLVLESQIATQIAVTGAEIPLKINDRAVSGWRSHRVLAGDRIKLGYATAGCRAYLSVAGGIKAPLVFGSAATVVREGLGGLYQNGKPLSSGDILPCIPCNTDKNLSLPQHQRPTLDAAITQIRVVLGYQHASFTQSQTQLFFSSEYSLSENSTRRGYRLSGAAVKPSLKGMLSEGICLGAIQFPADGQPIILLCDRQTIGGYPKIGSVFSLDIAKLAQLMPGRKLRFEAISIEQAHSALKLHEQQFLSTPLDIDAQSQV